MSEVQILSILLILGVLTIVGLTIVNLAIFGFCLKLYTEFFKERVKGKE